MAFPQVPPSGQTFHFWSGEISEHLTDGWTFNPPPLLLTRTTVSDLLNYQSSYDISDQIRCKQS